MNNKSIFKSKTVLVNVIIAAAGFFPGVAAYVSENPEQVLTMIATAGIFLRMVTKNKVRLFPD